MIAEESALIAACSYAVGAGLSWYARRRCWSRQQRQRIPRTAALCGLVLGSGLAVWSSGGDVAAVLRGALAGLIAGLAASGGHEVGRKRREG